MRKTTAERKDKMNDNRINDYGKMRRDGETLDRKQFTTTLHKHTGIEWLEEGHKRNNWWRTSEVNKRWLRTRWVDFNSEKTQSNGTNDDESPGNTKNKRTIKLLALGNNSKGSH